MLRGFIRVTGREKSRQGEMVRHLEEKPLTEPEAFFCDMLRQNCYHLVEGFHRDLKRMTPKEVGQYLAVIHGDVVALALLMLQRPSAQQVQEYCMSLQAHIDHAYLRMFDPAEVANFVAAYNRSFPRSNDRSHLTLDTPDRIRRASEEVQVLTTDFLDAFINEVRRNICKQFNIIELWDLSKSFDLASGSNSRPNPVLQPRIELKTFCTPTQVVLRGNNVCPICYDNGDVDGPYVVTKCLHHFHETCLDRWVNYSGQAKANRCPECRTKMFAMV